MINDCPDGVYRAESIEMVLSVEGIGVYSL